MASITAPSRHSDRPAADLGARSCVAPLLRPDSLRQRSILLAIALVVAAVAFMLPIALRAQGSAPHISAVTPDSGKAGDSVTISGENLGKDKVAAVYLSDAKLDHKAVVVDEEATKIVIKVPNDVKPGNYNVSIQEGGAIYIQPVIFKVTS